MKAALFAFSVALVVLSFSNVAFAQRGNPCAGVSCSGAGQCVVVQGRPSCSCQQGYAPDSSGLNCIANSGRPVVVMDADLDTPRRDLPGYNAWLGGVITISVGGLTTVVGLGVLLGALGNDALFWPGTGIGIGGCLIMLAGLIPYAIGAVRMRNARRRELMQSYRFPNIQPSFAFTREGTAVFGLNGAF